jgi:hypothetical protein
MRTTHGSSARYGITPHFTLAFSLKRGNTVIVCSSWKHSEPKRAEEEPELLLLDILAESGMRAERFPLLRNVHFMELLEELYCTF